MTRVVFKPHKGAGLHALNQFGSQFIRDCCCLAHYYGLLVFLNEGTSAPQIDNNHP
jgi:hypothetical protein